MMMEAKWLTLFIIATLEAKFVNEPKLVKNK